MDFRTLCNYMYGNVSHDGKDIRSVLNSITPVWTDFGECRDISKMEYHYTSTDYVNSSFIIVGEPGLDISGEYILTWTSKGASLPGTYISNGSTTFSIPTNTLGNALRMTVTYSGQSLVFHTPGSSVHFTNLRLWKL